MPDHTKAIEAAARRIGAVQDDRIPGLWFAPGYPELTTAQMIQAATLADEVEKG